MALIIYDGTNPTTAQALSGVDDCVAFAASYYGSNLAGSEAEKEATILRTNSYMMGLPWSTAPENGLEQTVPFPRVGFDGVPWQIIQAQHMFARAEHQTTGALNPTVTSGGLVKREKVDVLEVEYVEPKTADASRQLVTDALTLLKPFLKAGALADMGLTDHSRTWGIYTS